MSVRSLLSPPLNHALAAASLALLAPLSAQATGGLWNTGAAGQAGNGAASATPWVTSPAVGSFLAEWNVFNATIDNLPDIAGAGTATETSGTAFVTSGGNIYSFSAPTAFTVTLDSLPAGAWDVYLRIATLGTVVNTNATLNGTQAARSITYTEAITGGFGGGEEESLWQWNGVAGTGTFTFNFASTGSSMSLDQLAVYARPSAVPEPGSLALMGVGLAAMALMRRRSTQH